MTSVTVEERCWSFQRGHRMVQWSSAAYAGIEYLFSISLMEWP